MKSLETAVLEWTGAKVRLVGAVMGGFSGPDSVEKQLAARNELIQAEIKLLRAGMKMLRTKGRKAVKTS